MAHRPAGGGCRRSAPDSRATARCSRWRDRTVAMPFDLPRRIVEPELLDQLAADDPRARVARSDLRRINRVLATLAIVLAGLDRIVAKSRPPLTMLELGAGDGSLMLRIAKHRKARWP